MRATIEYLYEYVGLGPSGIADRLGRVAPSINTIKKIVAPLERGSREDEDQWSFVDATPEEWRWVGEYIADASGGGDWPWPSAEVAKWYIALRRFGYPQSSDSARWMATGLAQHPEQAPPLLVAPLVAYAHSDGAPDWVEVMDRVVAEAIATGKATVIWEEPEGDDDGEQ